MVTAPLGLLALLAIPIIIAIHLFRRRFPERTVAGLFLWRAERESPPGGDKRERLPITASLLLECLAALALALIIAGVRISSASVVEHAVIVLDDSASMAAADARGESPRDRAVRFVAGELDRMGASGRVTLVRSGERPAVIVGPSALALEARGVLESWQPQAAHHSWGITLQLAHELAGSTGHLTILTDGPPDAPSEADGVRWLAVGTPLTNVGIVGAERTLAAAQGGGVISLTLGNYSERPAERRLTLTAGDRTVLTKTLTVPPGASSMNLPLAAGLPAVRVMLDDDALRRDNEVVLVEPRPQIVAVQDALPPGRGRDALEKAIDALSGVTRAAPGHLSFVESPELAKAQTPGVWRIAIGAPPDAMRATGEAGDFIGPFTMEKRHPLLAGATLDGVVWTGAMPVKPQAFRPLASAGDRLLVGTVGDPSRTDPTVLFNIDLARTNLIRSPDWPILISNLVEMRRQELPGLARWNYRVGEWVRVRLGRAPTAPVRVRVGALERPLTGSRDIQFVPPGAGLVEILEGDAVLFTVGVNFLDDSESDLRGRRTSDSPNQREVAKGSRVETALAFDPLYWVLLAIAVLALAGNWWLLGRRTAHA